MNVILLVGTIIVGALSTISILLAVILALRALRRGAELEAEMKAPSFAFRFHLQPHDARHTSSELPQSAEAD